MEPADMTVVEWQRARINWQQQRHQGYFTGTPWSQDAHANPLSILSPSTSAFHSCSAFGDGGSVPLSSSMSSDLIHYPILDSPFINGGEGSIVEAEEGAVLRKSNYPLVVVDTEKKATPLERGDAPVAAAEQHSTNGRKGSSRKRKAVHQGSNQEPEEDYMDMIIKGDGCHTDALVEPKLESPAIPSNINGIAADGNDKPSAIKHPSSDTSEEKYSKVSEPPPKTDYIHVRARRGQATDSHSLAERARRERISKRMKLLQDLVPGCNKVTGKAGVLEEIINYVQSLQRQVEFLSMKLAAAVSPIPDANMDVFLEKEVMQMIPGCGGVAPTGMLPPPELLDASFLIHANTIQTQQAVAVPTAIECGSLDVAIGSSCPDEQAAVLHRSTAGALESVSECCSGLEAYKVRAVATTCPWDAELQGFYNVDELHRLLEIGVTPSATACSSSNFGMITDVPSPAKL